MAGDMSFACVEILGVTKELTKDNVKDLEFFLSQRHPPWTKSDNGDNRDVLEKMKQRGIWVFDIQAKRCNLLMLAKCMDWIKRNDLGQRLRSLDAQLKFQYGFIDSQVAEAGSKTVGLHGRVVTDAYVSGTVEECDDEMGRSEVLVDAATESMATASEGPLASFQSASPVPVGHGLSQNNGGCQRMPVQATDLSLSSMSRPPQPRNLPVTEGRRLGTMAVASGVPPRIPLIQQVSVGPPGAWSEPCFGLSCGILEAMKMFQFLFFGKPPASIMSADN